MEEGTRRKNVDERLGSQETRMKEFIDGVTKSREEMLKHSAELYGKMKGMENRMGGMDASLKEIKQLILGMQSQNRDDRVLRTTIIDVDSRSRALPEFITNNPLHSPLPSPIGTNFSTLTSIPAITNVATLQLPAPTLIPPTSLNISSIPYYPQPYFSTVSSGMPHVNTQTSTPFTVPFSQFTGINNRNPHLIVPPFGPYGFLPAPFSTVTIGPYPSHHTPHTFNPLPKLEFSKFYGNDPKGWVLKAGQYFDFVNIDEGRKVKMAAMHFEGKANVWYRYYQSSKVNVSWKAFQLDVILRIENPEQLDVQDQFNKLKQTTTVAAYEDQFEELRALILHKNKGFTEDYFLSSFISGLKDYIKMLVQMFRPSTSADALYLAKQEEARLSKISMSTYKVAAPKTTNLLSIEPKSHSSIFSPINKVQTKEVRKGRSTLSSKEIVECRACGQCFYCDDPFRPGQECKSKLYKLMGEDVEEGDVTEVYATREEKDIVCSDNDIVTPPDPGSGIRVVMVFNFNINT